MTANAASTPLTIALDAMGGDHAPDMVIDGAEIARQHHPTVRFLIFGDEARIGPLLAQRPKLAEMSEVRHTSEIVTNDAKPSQALRGGRESSMRLSINAVADGEAHCVVSAGNTGALMAMAKFVLKTMPGIDRPAIATFFPTLRSESVLLDMGANIECRPEHLVQFAVMGAVFAKSVLGLKEPTIGVLNVGGEALKGNDVVKEAAAQLREMEGLPGRFEGFVEGDDIPTGTVDVIVTDGFTGNIALKTAEGTVKLFAEYLRRTFRSSILARIGYVLARGAFLKLRDRLDPRKYNGAMFLGLGGICIKSHGGTDAHGFASAIDAGIDLVLNGFNDKVRDGLHHFENQAQEGISTKVGDVAE